MNMKNKKLTDVLFIAGLCIMATGIVLGIILGFLTGGNSFNLVPSITCWLLSIIIGSGFITVSSSLNEVNENKAKDEEILRLIMEKVQNEDK